MTEALGLKSPLKLTQGHARGFPVASGDAPKQMCLALKDICMSLV